MAWRRVSVRGHAPLYSMPHLSLAMMGLPVRSLRKGFGLTGTCASSQRTVRRSEAGDFATSGAVHSRSRGASRWQLERTADGEASGGVRVRRHEDPEGL